MASTKPYLIRAIREWAVDNGLTPQILVDADIDGVEVPRQHVAEGRIILNIGGQAVQMRELTNERLRFSARFQGTPFEVNVPIAAVLAIYARENGQGIFFKDPDAPAPQPDSEADVKTPKPHLKLVK